MKVLVTGSDGYIGAVLARRLEEAGHDVVGLDSGWFAGCDFGEEGVVAQEPPADIRDVATADLKGFDAVVHLAAISNDPLGDLDPECTYAINHRASVRLARLARQAGVQRFVFSSSCSLYGAAASDEFLTEEATFNPVTPYGESKVLVERDVSQLADDTFSPTFLRNATVYGTSPRLRCDLVVNDLVATAYTSGEVVIKSDGTPWRPLVHIEDVAGAFRAVLEAPRDRVHNQSFNIGRTSENYQVHDLADIVAEIVEGSRVVYAEGGGPDARSYRVDFSKAEQSLPGFKPRWTVRQGVAQLYDAYRRNALTAEDLAGPRFVRVRRIRELLDEGRLEPSLRWARATTTGPAAR